MVRSIAKAKARVLKHKLARQWNVDRRKPYTVEGARRVGCIRCGAPGSGTWQVCADKRRFRVLCSRCDIALNRLVLEWAGDPKVDARMCNYVITTYPELVQEVLGNG